MLVRDTNFEKLKYDKYKMFFVPERFNCVFLVGWFRVGTDLVLGGWMMYILCLLGLVFYFRLVGVIIVILCVANV